MITAELLTATGTIESLLTLEEIDDGLTLAEVSDETDISRGTARERLEGLINEGFVTHDAALRDERAVRVYALTDEGKSLSETLDSLVHLEDGQEDEDGS